MNVSRNLLSTLETWQLMKRWGDIELHFKNGVLTGIKEHPSKRIETDDGVEIELKGKL